MSNPKFSLSHLEGGRAQTLPSEFDDSLSYYAYWKEAFRALLSGQAPLTEALADSLWRLGTDRVNDALGAPALFSILNTCLLDQLDQGEYNIRPYHHKIHAQLDAWLTQFPNHPLTIFMKIQGLFELAALSRGADLPHTVTEQGWQDLSAYTRKGLEMLGDHAEILASVSSLKIIAWSAARYAGDYQESDLRRELDKDAEKEPQWYVTRARFRLSRWGGTFEAFEALFDEARANLPADLATLTIGRIWSQVEMGFDDYREQLDAQLAEKGAKSFFKPLADYAALSGDPDAHRLHCRYLYYFEQPAAYKAARKGFKDWIEGQDEWWQRPLIAIRRYEEKIGVRA